MGEAIRIRDAGLENGTRVFVDCNPEDETHVALPLDGPLDDAAVEKAAEAASVYNGTPGPITYQGIVRAAITAYVRAVGGGE